MTHLEQAIQILKNHGNVGIPTETVYGLAGRIDSPAAIEQIFKLKERPFFDPLIVHVANLEQARSVTSKWNEASEVLAQSFWPGSLTLILPKSANINTMITSGLETVGVRIPNHTATIELISKLNVPLAAPSANKFKKTSPSSAKHVKHSFPDLFVLDGGDCEVGIESTIVHALDDQINILRPGMISISDITNALRKSNIMTPVEMKESEIAPGHLKHHYMPELPLILKYSSNAPLSELPKELLISPKIFKLPNNPIKVARELYQKLREFDHDASSIIFELDESYLELEEWQGIINRLEKAASYKLSK